MNAWLRGDMAARAAFYKALFEVGGITPNQICASRTCRASARRRRALRVDQRRAIQPSARLIRRPPRIETVTGQGAV
jgi:hypothetical protein